MRNIFKSDEKYQKGAEKYFQEWWEIFLRVMRNIFKSDEKYQKGDENIFKSDKKYHLNETNIMANIRYLPSRGTTRDVGGMISTTSRKNT